MSEYLYDILSEKEMKQIGKNNHVSDGSKTSFYDIPDSVNDVDDLCEYLNLSFDEGNCLKSIFGLKADRHSGTNKLRDANKLVHYANRILKRIKNEVPN